MAMPMTKVSVGKSGYGAAHASYITRFSALDPEGRTRERSFTELSLPYYGTGAGAEPTVSETLNDNLSERALNQEKNTRGARGRDADPIWTWNAPQFLTGEWYGNRLEGYNNNRPTEANDRRAAEQKPQDRLTLAEKVENIKLHFRSREEFERRKGGRTHYRVILSFDVPATNQQITELANNFLGQAFPKAIGFGAIHRDTEHPHAHIYLHSRQIDGKRIQLKNTDFRSIDEKWARIYADFTGDRSLYIEHLRKKEETKQWKIAAAEAYRKG